MCVGVCVCDSLLSLFYFSYSFYPLFSPVSNSLFYFFYFNFLSSASSFISVLFGETVEYADCAFAEG